ncbi:nucleolar protein 12-domain-containing protein [Pterulicium gracile]|uniref:Nucleolar protein 12-domain-containing protein n=1 Tax=Pterulicium gracile TaxID=1884261 RepID=A0A5C3QK45_9AGAR|nr:nucleolar protein 12-domain-containing protein [Pterula gracilis]
MDNLSRLTRAHSAIAAKKRFKREQIPEVTFDEDARREFLTGFHKRKLAKANAARKKAQDREKQERQETRRENRRTLREQASENAAQVEAAYGNLAASHDDDEWEGLGRSGKGKGKAKDEEYETEETIATVTVVEDFDPDELLHAPSDANARDKDTHARPEPRLPVASKPARPKSTAGAPKKKKSSSSSKYGTNASRKHDRNKQFKRRTEKAERAGGKASRSRGPKR